MVVKTLAILLLLSSICISCSKDSDSGEDAMSQEMAEGEMTEEEMTEEEMAEGEMTGEEMAEEEMAEEEMVEEEVVEEGTIKVLLIYDDFTTNSNTVSLKKAIEVSGIHVTMSEVSETAWNNTNPSLTGFDAVVHMNGTTWSTEMPEAGQQALVDFVENKGGHYIAGGFNSDEFFRLGRMQSMIDLVLLNNEYNSSLDEHEIVSDQESHPVLENISNFSFEETTDGLQVSAVGFNIDPSVVLMTEDGNDAVVVREFGEGKVLNFSHAGNYNGGTSFSNENIQNIVVNFINWE